VNLQTHPNYEGLIEKALRSHASGRSAEGITPKDIGLARLYSYAFRAHAIGAFHATCLAIGNRPTTTPLAAAYRRRATETLSDLAGYAMDPIANDFRAVISTLHRYHQGVQRVVDSLDCDYRESHDSEIAQIGQRFCNIMQQITTSGGIHLTQDTDAPEQASFVVPNLGITIVPLVYGDHHSWNLGYLSDNARDVPTHRHQDGVEIHLGYEPLQGETILGDYRAEVAEGYAMPIPPKTLHGYVNTSNTVHHVPFIFGSLKQAGWGVFLDVESQDCEIENQKRTELVSEHMNHSVYLEREIAAAEALSTSQRKTLISASQTDRTGSGGLELSVARVDQDGLSLLSDSFRIVSIVRGQGMIHMAGQERAIQAHDHFGIPSDMDASIKQQGETPMIILDATIELT
jgi:hypothetical protein